MQGRQLVAGAQEYPWPRAPHLDGQEAREAADGGLQQVAARVQRKAQRDGLKQDRVLRVGLVHGRALGVLPARCWGGIWGSGAGGL